VRRPAFFAADASPGARLRLALLLPLSWLYAAGARIHRALYERGLLRRRRLACRVVSVGNLVVGGSGKTPTAAYVARGLRGRGHRVVVATRGYGRAGREPVEVVSDGRHVLSRVEVAGDEPLVLAAHAPGVPVLVGPDRDLVGLRAVAAFGAQVLVLDDGFHHYRLARDVEIVLVDGVQGFGNRRVLPAGPLREHPSGLARAHAIGVVDGPLRPRDEALLARHAPQAFRFRVVRRPTSVRPLAGGPRVPAARLAGEAVGLLCGLAHPEGFRATVESLGARVVAERPLPDHHRYRPADLRGIGDEAPCWLTTEKDALKILPRWAAHLDLRVLAIEAEVEDGERFLDWLDDRLRAKPRGRSAALPPRPVRAAPGEPSTSDPGPEGGAAAAQPLAGSR
jgi:tetraacyldisaccharide 4'-kinase